MRIKPNAIGTMASELAQLFRPSRYYVLSHVRVPNDVRTVAIKDDCYFMSATFVVTARCALTAKIKVWCKLKIKHIHGYGFEAYPLTNKEDVQQSGWETHTAEADHS